LQQRVTPKQIFDTGVARQKGVEVGVGDQGHSARTHGREVVVRASDVKTEKIGDLAGSMKAQDLTPTVREHFVPVHEPVD
jgi:hypothetical protein